MRIITLTYNDPAHWDKVFPDAEVLFVKVGHYLPKFRSDDIVIFHGGTDLNPALYNHNNIASDRPDTARDTFEVQAFEEAVFAGSMIYSICRGAQLACVLNGGFLYQHIDGHGFGGHNVKFADGTVLRANSCHHQMMGLVGIEILCDVLAVATPQLSREYVYDGQFIPHEEPEVVWFQETRTLAVQGHPEWLEFEDPFVQKCMSLAREHWKI